MDKFSIIKRLSKLAQVLDNMNMSEQADQVTDVMQNITDTPQVTAWKNFARSLAKKDPDFIPPRKPNVGIITYKDVTDDALSEYHRYKNNKRQTSKFTYEEENQLKQLAQNADRAR